LKEQHEKNFAIRRKRFVQNTRVSCCDNADAFYGDSYDGVSCACVSPFYDAYAFFLTAYRFKVSKVREQLQK